VHISTLIKYFVIAWGLPIVMVLIPLFTGPGVGKQRSDFSMATFVPARVWTTERKDRKGADSFDLRLESPEGKVFYIRNPEREPIEEIYRKVPAGAKLEVRYTETVEGNVLLEITEPGAASPEPILSYEWVMQEYASRRTFIFVVAAIWCALANLISLALWKALPVKRERPEVA
jgi:hypothetical protein